jgi:hypothetical protein
MNHKNEMPAKRQLSPVVATLMFMTLLTLGICGASPLLEEIKNGKAYTLGVIFNNTIKVNKVDSPIEFWMNIGWQALGFGIGIVLGVGGAIQTLREIFVNHKKKVKEKNRR